jgi:O-antigen/teichoic acid export membrane protein
MQGPSGSDREGQSGAGPTLVDGAALARRARQGVLWLTLRTILQQVAILGGTVYLARVLGPTEFGAFWIVQFALSFFALFGDAGLGAALIQKHDPATQRELSSVFWSQMLLGSAVVLVICGAAPWVVRFWPDLPQNGVWMLRALSVSLLLTSMRVIPTILLERDLLFGRLSAIDLVLTVSFYGSAVWFAFLGWGSFALVAAVIIQGAAGVVVAFAVRPWRPSLQFDVQLLRPILKFGMAFQAKHIIGFANGAVMPLYAGHALGRYALGLVTWSQNTAFFPLRIVDILGRVNFPLLSRLQQDPKAFARTLERTVQLGATVTLLFTALFLGLSPALVQVIYGEKWLPALPTLYVFAVAISVGFVVPIANGALDAIGKPRIMMRLGLFWTALNWVVVVATMHFGSGALVFSLAYCVHIFIGNLAVLWVVRKMIPDARLWPKIRVSLAAAVAAGCIGRWLLLPWAKGPFTLAAATLGVAAIFVGVVARFDGGVLREFAALVRRQEKPATGGL